MVQLLSRTAGKFCWLDLAARDAGKAAQFYEKVFGWSANAQAANGGAFVRLSLAGEDVGSLYQLRAAQLERGTPSHWTPYIGADDLDETVERAVASGGAVIIQPFAVSGVARIALIEDSVGALVGLWSSLKEERHGE